MLVLSHKIAPVAEDTIPNLPDLAKMSKQALIELAAAKRDLWLQKKNE